MLESSMIYRRVLQEILPPEQPSNLPNNFPCSKQESLKTFNSLYYSSNDSLKATNNFPSPAHHPLRNSHEDPSWLNPSSCNLPSLEADLDEWLACDETLSEENLHATDSSSTQRQYDILCNSASNTQLCANFSPTTDFESTLKCHLNSESFESRPASVVEGWTRQHPFDSSLTLSPHMRDTVFSWMKDVCLEENCEEETFFLSCAYLDRLVCHPSQLVTKDNLQMYAAVAMLLASKFKQADFMLPSLLYHYTDCSVTAESLKECERTALELLEWDLSILTPHAFVSPLLTLLPLLDPHLTSCLRKEIINYIDTSLFSLPLASLTPSLVASCCSMLAISLHTPPSIQQNSFSQVIALVNFEPESFTSCMRHLEETLSTQLEAFPPVLDPKAVISKSEPTTIRTSSHGNSLDTPKTSPIPSVDHATPPDVKDISID